MIIETNRQLLLVAQAKVSSSLPLTFSVPAPPPPTAELSKSAAATAANKTTLYDPQSGALNLSKIGKAVTGTSALPNRPVSALSQSLLSQSTTQHQPSSFHQSSPDRMRNKATSHATAAGIMSQDLQR